MLVRKTFGIKIEKYVQIETEIKKYTRAKKKCKHEIKQSGAVLVEAGLFSSSGG